MLIQINSADFFKALEIDYVPNITIYLSSLNPDIQTLNVVYYSIYLISIQQYYYETFLPEYIYDNCVYIIYSKSIEGIIDFKIDEIYINTSGKNIYNYNVVNYEYDHVDERYELDDIIIPKLP